MYMMRLRISSNFAYVHKKPFPERVYGKYLIHIAIESRERHSKGLTKLYLGQIDALLTKISSVENRHNVLKIIDFEQGFILAKIEII